MIASTALSTLFGAYPARAAPQGGNVASGTATISSAGSVTTINQSTTKAIINWQSFSVGEQETVNFNQPSVSAVTLNRVIGNESSVIAGAINANGQVFLVNSNGILFTSTSQVNVGGLVASTLDISNEDFLAGNYVFSGSSTNSVVNKGALTAANGGYVSLLGKTVSNQGVITATLGTVSLNAGSKITLNFEGNALIDVTLDEGTLDALVENKQLIKADGGKVIMTARAADAVLSAQVNNEGIVQARTMAALMGGSAGGGAAKKGSIKIKAEGGTTNIKGKLDASAPDGGDGGFIETSGDKVGIDAAATITTAASLGQTGTWLIDPDGFTIGAGGDITGATLSNQLANNNVTIESVNGSGTDGNITVNDAVSWSANTLTLNATNNIYVNNVMTVTGTGSFAANYGTGANADGVPYGLYTAFGGVEGTFGGKVDVSGTGTVVLQGETYTVINSVEELASISSDLDGNYVLGSNVTFLSTDAWASGLGSQSTPFSGNFNGLGHTITFNTPADGLFGVTSSTASVSNVGIGATVRIVASGIPVVGALADSNAGSIVNTFSTATVYGINAGGLVGINSGLIANSYQAGTVYNIYSNAGSATPTNVGGIAAINDGRILSSFVYDSTVGYSNANNTSGNAGIHVGGLVGTNNGEIDQSYAIATVSGGNYAEASAGGLVGYNTGSITDSYVGQSAWYFALRNQWIYTGSVKGTLNDVAIGGFVGVNAASGTITNAYVAAPVSGQNWGAAVYGGFAGINEGTITNAYYDQSLTTYTTDNGGATGLSAADARMLGSYSGFDGAVWASSADGHPILKNLPVYVSVSSTANLTYGASASEVTGSLSAYGLQWNDATSVLAFEVDDPALVSGSGHLNAGTYGAEQVLSSPAYTTIVGTISIAPKALTLATSGIVADKTYDGTTTATLTGTAEAGGLVGLVGDETLDVTYQDIAFANDGAGTGKSVLVSLSLADGTNGGAAANYVIADGLTTKATITPATLTATYTAEDKVYDGGTSAIVTVSNLTGVVAGDTVTATASGNFADADAGSDKTVTVSGVSLSGVDAANYVVVQAPTLTADIAPRPVTLQGAKVQDGSWMFDASDITITNVVPGDVVNLTGTTVALGYGGSHWLQPVGLSIDNANYTLSGATGSAVTYSSALPTGAAVVAGDVPSIAVSGTTMSVTQTSAKAIINWQTFNVGAGYTVNFDQQAGPTSVTLNRVIGNEQSIIAGTITAQGHVYIVNSAGVLFTGTSQVNVGALVASTQDMANDDFLAGAYVFGTNAATGSVSAYGTITVDGEDGYVALLGNGVTSRGTIVAHGGDIALVGGSGITLTEDAVTGALSGVTVEHADKVVSAGGVYDVSSQIGAGGVVESVGQAEIATGIAVSASGATGFADGYWLLTAPDDLDIAASGTISGSDLSKLLAVVDTKAVSRTGNVNVDEAVSWSAHTLSLVTTQDINVNDVMTVTGNGSLFASYGVTTSYQADAGTIGGLTEPKRDVTFHGINMAYAIDDAGNPTGSFKGKINFNSDGTLTMGSTGREAVYTVIHSAEELQAINSSTANFGSDVRYALGNDLDLNAVSDWTPIGTVNGQNYYFNGVFNGLGHTVTNLTSSRNGLFYAIGNVGYDVLAESAAVSNLGVTNVDISCTTACSAAGDYHVGGLAGISQGLMTNVFATGKINVEYRYVDYYYNDVGGLFGALNGYAYNSYADVDVTAAGFSNVGGFAGNSSSAQIYDSRASGDVWSDSFGRTVANVGGFVGYSQGATIVNSEAAGDVWSKGGYVGGFAGEAEMGTLILNSRATGNVFVDDTAYARSDYAGGFVGMIFDGAVAFSSSTGTVGSVTGDPATIGGFSGMVVSGLHAMSVGNYWNVETSGISTNGSGNYVPDGMDMEGTPFLDAYNAAYGTNLTQAQFHSGATGLSSADFATVSAQQGTDTGMAARSLESVMNGGAPIGGTPGGGGAPGEGGTPGDGGAPGAGGTPSEGGAPSAGGTPSEGGTPSAGGNPGEGGDPGSGTPILGATLLSWAGALGQTSAASVGSEAAAAANLPATARDMASTVPVSAGVSAALNTNIDTSSAPSAVSAVPRVEDEDRERRRRPRGEPGRASVERQRRPAAARPVAPEPGYGASIQSIEVDGQRYDLERGNPPPDGAPAPAATPAPAAPAGAQ